MKKQKFEAKKDQQYKSILLFSSPLPPPLHFCFLLRKISQGTNFSHKSILLLYNFWPLNLYPIHYKDSHITRIYFWSEHVPPPPPQPSHSLLLFYPIFLENLLYSCRQLDYTLLMDLFIPIIQVNNTITR